MSADESREGFLRRWSRQKIEAREAPPAPPAEPVSKAAAEAPAPVLPPVEELTIDSDFSGFFHPKVGEDVRRSALRKLFSDPHFNVMDGLDTYIDDYSKSEPIPAAMLASMKQAQRIIDWAAETPEQAEVRRATPPALPVEEESEAGIEALGVAQTEAQNEAENGAKTQAENEAGNDADTVAALAAPVVDAYAEPARAAEQASVPIR